MKRRGYSRTHRSGCGLLVVASAVTCLLWLMNRLVVASLYGVIVPDDFEYARLRVILQFLLLIGLLFPEWWLIDRTIQFVRASFGAIESPETDEK